MYARDVMSSLSVDRKNEPPGDVHGTLKGTLEVSRLDLISLHVDSNYHVYVKRHSMSAQDDTSYISDSGIYPIPEAIRPESYFA